MKNHYQKNRGFTLIETLVAVAILMLAILGPMSIASSGLTNSMLARDQVAAYYLAQEGLEYIRSIRDTNYLESVDSGTVDWMTGMEDCVEDSNNGGCYVDVLTPMITACGSACSERLFVDVDGFYTYQTAGNSLSPFTRTIKITEVGSENNEIKVEAQVSWRTGNIEKTVNLSENIMDLYNPPSI